MKSALMTLSLFATPWLAAAHEGHGVAGAHGHATDVWGFVALAVVAGAAIWWRKGK
jgi:hypothetical protein